MLATYFVTRKVTLHNCFIAEFTVDSSTGRENVFLARLLTDPFLTPLGTAVFQQLVIGRELLVTHLTPHVLL